MNEKIFQEKIEDIIEIINLEAIQQLPKSTEYFISDLHGEYEAFDHLVRNCSGVISMKVAELFGDELDQRAQKELCFQIYYPEDLLKHAEYNQETWIELLTRLVILTRYVSSKYTRSKVRRCLPDEYAYILEELLYQYDQEDKKEAYYSSIFELVVSLGLANEFAMVLANLIQQFVMDHLHILGDIYDRGPNPDLIMDRLMEFPSLDIQLGNHDIIWLGAYCGSLALLAVALRISLRYGHTELLEDGYGIDLSRLAKFSAQYYQDNTAFHPRGITEAELGAERFLSITQMHQAITIIQFKLESQIIKRRPDFKMEDRLLLDHLSADRRTVTVEGVRYPVSYGCFDLVDPDHPDELTLEEELVILDLLNQFQRSDRLQQHMEFLAERGTLYLKFNNNLLFHGCMPCSESGEFMEIEFNQQKYAGKDLMEFYQEAIKESAKDIKQSTDFATDLIWYIWCGPASTLFGKHSMKTFERYFLEDKSTHKELQNPYYDLRNDEAFVIKLRKNFGLEGPGYVVNGHTPVKAMSGENPVKANGLMLVIDGGLAKAYQKVTGIAGYTLVDNSHEVYIVAHHPFTSKEEALASFRDILPEQIMVRKRPGKILIKDTDNGQELNLKASILRSKWQLSES